jgi:hypothetical protein
MLATERAQLAAAAEHGFDCGICVDAVPENRSYESIPADTRPSGNAFVLLSCPRSSRATSCLCAQHVLRCGESAGKRPESKPDRAHAVVILD